MDPNATLKISAERLADLASVDPDATPGPAAALRQIGSTRPSGSFAVGAGAGAPPSQSPSQSGAFARPSLSSRAPSPPQSAPNAAGYGLSPSQRAPSHTPQPRAATSGSALGTVVLYVVVAVVVSAAVIALIALVGRLLA